MAYRPFAHWWGEDNPCKMGICIPWQIYKYKYMVDAATYFRDYLFSGTFFHYADPAPRHGLVPWFIDYLFDYDLGWQNSNWKTAMYLPMLHGMTFSNDPNSPYRKFEAKLKQAYQYGSDKLVLLGNEPNVPGAQGGSDTKVSDYMAAVWALRTGVPDLNYIGPNVLFQVRTNDWRDGRTWMNAFRGYVGNGQNKPREFGFHINANDPHGYSDYFDDIADWMAAWYPNDKFRITEAFCVNQNMSVQVATLQAALAKMDANPRCTGTYWFPSSDEYEAVTYPSHLSRSTGYPPNGSFPWPYSLTDPLGAEWNRQLNQRYAFPNPFNASRTSAVQAYPIDKPA